MPGTAAPTASASPSPSFVRPTPAPLPTPLEYVVHSGDSLTSIARRFGTTARSVALWNAGRYPTLDPASARYAPDRIGVGWHLVLVPGMTFEEAADASAGPDGAPTPMPSPVIPPGPTPRADGGAVFVPHVARTTTAVALTLELTKAGLPVASVDAVIDALAARGVAATAFVGADLLAGTDPAALDLVDRSGSGLLLGLARDAGRAAVPRRADAAEAAAAAKGATTKPWFRPATDGPTEAELAALGRAGWTYAIGWDVDASGAATASDIAASLVSRADGGSIVRLDLGDTDVAAAMPDILDGLAAHGLVPVTVAALLGR